LGRRLLPLHNTPVSSKRVQNVEERRQTITIEEKSIKFGEERRVVLRG